MSSSGLSAPPTLTVLASATPVLLHFRVTLTTGMYSVVQYVPRCLGVVLLAAVITGKLRQYHAKMRGNSVILSGKTAQQSAHV